MRAIAPFNDYSGTGNSPSGLYENIELHREEITALIGSRLPSGLKSYSTISLVPSPRDALPELP
jgi:hypothetical protein